MSEACDITKRPQEPENNPGPSEIKNILSEAKTIAIIGLSNKPHRESYMVGRYLKDHGYTVIPVHPNIDEWEGLKVYGNLGDIPGDVDIVDIFRRADAIGDLVPEIVAKKPKVAWLQLGIVNNEASKEMRSEGIVVVQNKCMKIEHTTLLGG